MLKLSEKQCASVDKMEDDDFVRDTAQKLKKKFLRLTNQMTRSMFAGKSTGLCPYAPVEREKVRRDFCCSRHFGPVFTCSPRWING